MAFLAHTNATQRTDQRHVNMPLACPGQKGKAVGSRVAVKI